MLSDPVSSCNLAADDNDGLQYLATIIMSFFTGAVIVYCIVNGTNLLNAFDLSKVSLLSSFEYRIDDEVGNLSTICIDDSSLLCCCRVQVFYEVASSEWIESINHQEHLSMIYVKILLTTNEKNGEIY